MRLRSLSVAILPLAIVACQASADESAETAGQEVSKSWLAGKLPPKSAVLKQVLALANDRTMTPDEYVEQCGITRQVANNIANYRDGDEPADSVDDQTFGTPTELDRIPYTDTEFWLAFIACAQQKYGSQPSGGVCATGTSKVLQSPLYLQFVVDDSSSMYGTKWDATHDALAEVFKAQAAKNDPSVAYGVNLLNSTKHADLAAVDASHAAKLVAALDDGPSGSTPLLAAIKTAYQELESFAPTGALANGTGAVVVLTDGYPDVASGILTFVQPHAAKAQLFSIGIGKFNSSQELDPAFLGELAVAGGTRASATCNPTEILDVKKACYMHVEPGAKPASQLAQELIGAFTKVRQDIAACDIGLQESGTGKVDAGNVTVVFSDGTVVKSDATNGWSLDDVAKPTKVLLRGTACDTLRGNKNLTAKVEVACK